MDHRAQQLENGEAGKVLGSTAQITFASFGGRSVEGKVDTGATTSSLHATNITINKQRNQVTFLSPDLSDNLVTLDLDGSQEVHSADAGGVTRPTVSLSVEVDGVPLNSATFNLNDRSKMDSSVLIGQNILKAGGFMIDPSKDQAPQRTEVVQDTPVRETAVLEAIEILIQHNVSLSEMVAYLRTAAINRIES